MRRISTAVVARPAALVQRLAYAQLRPWSRCLSSSGRDKAAQGEPAELSRSAPPTEDLIESLREKDAGLLERIHGAGLHSLIDDESVVPARYEIKTKQPINKPSDRSRSAPIVLAPEVGKLTPLQAMSLLAMHKRDPAQHSAEKLSAEFGIPLETLELVLEHVTTPVVYAVGNQKDANDKDGEQDKNPLAGAGRGMVHATWSQPIQLSHQRVVLLGEFLVAQQRERELAAEAEKRRLQQEAEVVRAAAGGGAGQSASTVVDGQGQSFSDSQPLSTSPKPRGSQGGGGFRG